MSLFTFALLDNETFTPRGTCHATLTIASAEWGLSHSLQIKNFLLQGRKGWGSEKPLDRVFTVSLFPWRAPVRSTLSLPRKASLQRWASPPKTPLPRERLDKQSLGPILLLIRSEIRTFFTLALVLFIAKMTNTLSILTRKYSRRLTKYKLRRTISRWKKIRRIYLASLLNCFRVVFLLFVFDKTFPLSCDI